MDALTLLGKANANFLPGIEWSAPDHATLKAIAAGTRHDGMIGITRNDNYRWMFKDAGTEVDTSENLAMAPTVGSGSWVRLANLVDMKLAIDKTMADATVLFTVPTGMKIRIARAFWEVSVGFSGGSSSAIGVSSSNAGYNTKGDILGGAGGDVAATLVAGYTGGTLGAKYASNGVIVLVAADTVRYDKIASTYTAGSGFVHLIAELLS
jgi:hypothetical protein